MSFKIPSESGFTTMISAFFFLLVFNFESVNDFSTRNPVTVISDVWSIFPFSLKFSEHGIISAITVSVIFDLVLCGYLYVLYYFHRNFKFKRMLNSFKTRIIVNLYSQMKYNFQ